MGEQALFGNPVIGSPFPTKLPLKASFAWSQSAFQNRVFFLRGLYKGVSPPIAFIFAFEMKPYFPSERARHLARSPHPQKANLASREWGLESQAPPSPTRVPLSPFLAMEQNPKYLAAASSCSHRILTCSNVGWPRSGGRSSLVCLLISRMLSDSLFALASNAQAFRGCLPSNI